MNIRILIGCRLYCVAIPEQKRHKVTDDYAVENGIISWPRETNEVKFQFGWGKGWKGRSVSPVVRAWSYAGSDCDSLGYARYEVNSKVIYRNHVPEIGEPQTTAPCIRAVAALDDFEVAVPGPMWSAHLSTDARITRFLREMDHMEMMEGLKFIPGAQGKVRDTEEMMRRILNPQIPVSTARISDCFVDLSCVPHSGEQGLFKVRENVDCNRLIVLGVLFGMNHYSLWEKVGLDKERLPVHIFGLILRFNGNGSEPMWFLQPHFIAIVGLYRRERGIFQRGFLISLKNDLRRYGLAVIEWEDESVDWEYRRVKGIQMTTCPLWESDFDYAEPVITVSAQWIRDVMAGNDDFVPWPQEMVPCIGPLDPQSSLPTGGCSVMTKVREGFDHGIFLCDHCHDAASSSFNEFEGLNMMTFVVGARPSVTMYTKSFNRDKEDKNDYGISLVRSFGRVRAEAIRSMGHEVATQVVDCRKSALPFTDDWLQKEQREICVVILSQYARYGANHLFYPHGIAVEDGITVLESNYCILDGVEGLVPNAAVENRAQQMMMKDAEKVEDDYSRFYRVFSEVDRFRMLHGQEHGDLMFAPYATPYGHCVMTAITTATYDVRDSMYCDSEPQALPYSYGAQRELQKEIKPILILPAGYGGFSDQVYGSKYGDLKRPITYRDLRAYERGECQEYRMDLNLDVNGYGRELYARYAPHPDAMINDRHRVYRRAQYEFSEVEDEDDNDY